MIHRLEGGGLESHHGLWNAPLVGEKTLRTGAWPKGLPVTEMLKFLCWITEEGAGGQMALSVKMHLTVQALLAGQYHGGAPGASYCSTVNYEGPLHQVGTWSQPTGMTVVWRHQKEPFIALSLVLPPTNQFYSSTISKTQHLIVRCICQEITDFSFVRTIFLRPVSK